MKAKNTLQSKRYGQRIDKLAYANSKNTCNINIGIHENIKHDLMIDWDYARSLNEFTSKISLPGHLISSGYTRTISCHTERKTIKKGVTQGFTQCQTLGGFEDEHLSDQVKHVVPVRVAPQFIGYILKQVFTVLPHVLAIGAVSVPIESAVACEIFDPRLSGHSVRDRPEDTLHHGQVLAVVVSLKQRNPQGSLEYDTADGPHVAGM